MTISPYAIEHLRAEIGELLGRVEQGRDLAALRVAYAADNPLGFDLRRFLVTELGLVPYPKFDTMVEGLTSHVYNEWIGANSTGKTQLAAGVAVALGVVAGWLVLVTAPREHQLKHNFMRKVFAAGERARLPGEFGTLGWRLTRGDEAGILGFTSDAVSRYGGYHSPVGTCVILDEAQGIEGAEAWEGLRGAMMGAGVRRWLSLGNPLFAQGRFREVAGLPHYHVVRIAAADSPNVIEGRTVIPGLIGVTDIEETARDFGIGSNYYRSRILAEFPTQNEEALFDRRWLDAAAERWATEPHPSDETETILSVDPARYGADETAVCIRRGVHVLAFAAWHHSDTMETIGKLRVLGEQYRVTPYWAQGGNPNRAIKARGRVIVDAIGLGAGVLDRLREVGYRIEEYNSGFKATVALPGIQFANRRAQSFWHLATELQRGRIALPADEKLFDELLQVKARSNSVGKVLLESKDDLRARLGRSPDRADALAMAFHADSGYSVGVASAAL